MVLGATRSGLPGACDQTLAGHLFGAAALEGYDATPAVLIAAVPTSRIGDMSGLLLGPIFGVTLLGLLLVTVGGVLLGNYISRPVSEIEDGLLAVINGNSSLRFQIEHAELGGLVFRINSLLNELTGVPEDTSDDEGRPSSAPSAGPYAEALAVGERALPPELSEPGEASVLAAEPAEVYYERLYGEYLRAKRELGEPVDHITYEAFRARIEQNERSMAEKHGRPVRFRVELRDGAVALAAVPLPG
jgi:hypothetical protein